MNSAKTAFLGSVALLAGLSALLYWQTRNESGQVGPPLVVYCAEALRVPMEAIKQDFENETKQPVELRYGPSQDILTQLGLTKQGDLFLPADESYIALAKSSDLVAEILPMATMQAVLVAKPGLERVVKSWDDVVVPDVKLGLANPDAAAISAVLRTHLRKQGRWEAVEKQRPVMLGTVNQVGNAAQLGTIDIGVMWDAVAMSFPKVTRIDVPELKEVTAQVQIAVAKSSSQPTQALRFARFATAKDRGLEHLQRQGFTTPAHADAWKQTPELVLYAGSMLRPAIEKTVEDFQRREGVRITTVYNGCGILVAGMKDTGERPDVYFACDTQFMSQVSELFGTPTNVSTNQLVIATAKGNPHELKSLKDLGKPGLRVGVGHEQQCALGALTKESFIKTGTYAAVQKNIAVQSPSGDLLIVQLRGGSLDAVVCYQSNVTPFTEQFDAIAVTGIPCATPSQPLAIGKDSPFPRLAERLEAAMRSAESRRRFEELGFGWEGK